MEARAERKQQKTIAAAALLVVGLLLLARSGCGPRDEPGSVSTKARQAEQAAEILGRHLARACPRAKVLLITDPPDSGDYREELVDAATRGLKRGFRKTKCSLKAVDAPRFSGLYVPPPHPSSPFHGPTKSKWLPSTNEWFIADALFQVVAEHPKCNLAISMIGLPIDGEAPALPKTKKGEDVKLAVLMGELGRPKFTAKLFAKGTLTGAMVWDPRQTAWVNRVGLADVPVEESMPGCVLVKPGNAQAIINAATEGR